jgi:L-threonylcarbamoyladenylate synthase
MIHNYNEGVRGKAVEVIHRGGLIAFRTDTFYGLGVDPFNRVALQALRNLKGREEAKPILVLIADRADVDRFIEQRSSLFDRGAELYWPGPLTLVGQARKELLEELTAGTRTIGIRLPNDTAVRDLVRACGGALTATSANPARQPPARTAREVANYFPGGIDLIINGGGVGEVEASTVLDVSDAEPRLIREGAITKTDLMKRLSEIEK